eukprot:g837.t1
MDGVDGRPMWVTYKDGVYDISAFHLEHPGGKIIKQAAGGDVSPFWDVWAYRHHAPKVGEYLKRLRIGTLRQEDRIEGDSEMSEDPYASEPVRDLEIQTVLTERPFCSETPSSVLVAKYLTHSDALYVRNHAPVPSCAWESEDESRNEAQDQHEIVFDASETNEDERTLTVGELQSQFETCTITSVLQCAGNRASEDIAATGPSGFSNTPFEKITNGMVGNVQWSGVRLADVLSTMFPAECAESREAKNEVWHVIFEGADGYSASTPLARVIREENDCLLATRMNGVPLSPDHGFPLRVVLPGIAGARNVKWLESISLARAPVDAPWNSYYYKTAAGKQIQTLPLQSLILSQSKRSDDEFRVDGVAYSGGSGNEIARVQISTDNGCTWSDAKILTDEVIQDDSHKSFGWVRWTVDIAPTFVGHVWEVKDARNNPLLRDEGRVDDYARIIPASTCAYDNSKTHISFVSSSEVPNAYRVYWVKKSDGSEKIMGRIDGEKGVHLRSYQGHLFRVRNVENQLLMECTASSKSQTYDVSTILSTSNVSDCKNSSSNKKDDAVSADASKVDDGVSTKPVLLRCKTVYERKCIEGFTIMLEPGLTDTYKSLISEVTDDLKEIVRLLPPSALKILRCTRIYFNERLCFGDARKPTIGRGICHHPSAKWLENHGNQTAKAGCVECYQARHYLQWRAQQPAMLLHELSHHLHFCLGHAADRIILDAFEKAKARGRYERVGYCGSASRTKRHYALTNHHEYFAECSEAYWSSSRFRNDYEPYTRSELEDFDLDGFKMCEIVWGLPGKMKPVRCANPI